MPCFNREKQLSSCPKKQKGKENDLLAPKPVHPRAIKFHGLLGLSNAAQHLVIDKKWLPDSLTEQYKGFIDCLSSHVVYKKYESKAYRKFLAAKSKRLKSQCASGRLKLQKISTANNAHKIRNLLMNRIDMQRLYQNMPIEQVNDNINQRTFVMRKERDRLLAVLQQRKQEYKQLLKSYAEVETRIQYENEFVLEEELISRVLLKKLDNSNLRLNAIRTINTTYKKMVQVLSQDEIFYEPILRSLQGDMDDQANFIRYILHLGKPAIARFNELTKKYQQHYQKSRKDLQEKIRLVASLSTQRKPFSPGVLIVPPEHYVRQTKSMTDLKRELEAMEETIKHLNFVTLTSQAEEIYPRLKDVFTKNVKLKNSTDYDIYHHEVLLNKGKYADVFQQVLLNNLSEEEISRLERIKDLKKIQLKEEEFETQTVEHMRNRADAFVMLRLCIWDMMEILRHVHNKPRTFKTSYRTSYLKLPLLKFEMYNTFAAPPELYEENFEKLMSLLKHKVYKLMTAYSKIKEDPQLIMENREKYHTAFMQSLSEPEFVETVERADDGYDRAFVNIPTRKQIKAEGAKLIEAAKKAMD